MAFLIKKSDEILNKLIATGPDASPNLFDVIVEPPLFKYNEDDPSFRNFSSRIVNFTAPERTSTFVQLNYMGTSINVVSPGSNINNIQKINLRVDRNYQVYSFLKEMIPINSAGHFKFYPYNEIPTIKVRALAMGDNGELIEKYTWQFNNCYILGVSPIQYSYDSSGGMTAVVSFIYKEVIEN